MAKTLAELRAEARKPIAQIKDKSTVVEFIERNKQAMSDLLPAHISADKITRLALTALRTTPALQKSSLDSFMGSLMLCSAMGLEPNTPAGHCYLVPFKGQVQVIIGYKGMVDLCYRSGLVLDIYANTVREDDYFEYEYGTNQKLIHRPKLGSKSSIIGFYAFAHMRDAGSIFTVMSKDEIDAVASMSGPWRDYYEAMAQKTALRRLFKFMPSSPNMALAMRYDETTIDQADIQVIAAAASKEENDEANEPT